MEASAIIMLIFGVTLLYGGLATFITIAAKSEKSK
ncbi:MAG: MetS family NSS transporter small subunit [Clostridia bacterium]|nr:MetS family NSS transporter small subunit [Clostridia bacterium]